MNKTTIRIFCLIFQAHATKQRLFIEWQRTALCHFASLFCAVCRPFIVTDVRGVCLSVRPSVCLSRGSIRLRCAKTAEQIKILFAMNAVVGSRNTVLEGASDPSTGRVKVIRYSLRQITLAYCYS